MIFEERVNVNFSDMLEDVEIPNMYLMRQKFNDYQIEDIAAAVSREILKIPKEKVAHKTIAITAGSRGIKHNFEILKTIIETFSFLGAKPYLVAAMGSHGGGTSEGQLHMLHNLGISEDKLGVPIKISMETQQIGAMKDHTPVYLSKDALAADLIFVTNKIKPHADFKGAYESGLAKMMVIGLGKHKGCSVIHKLGFEHFPAVLPEAAEIIIENTNIIGALAIVENAYDEIMRLEYIETNRILAREKELLNLAKDNIARLQMKELDVLIVDEIGKHISGEGLDPNVTGRPGSYLNDGFDHIKIGTIFVRDVAEISAGNGAGIGMADITTVNCVKKLDLGAMYTNSITAGILGPSRLPVILNNDLEALKTAIKISAPRRLKSAKIARIRNTLLLDEIWVSEAVKEEMGRGDNFEILKKVTFDFDESGNISNVIEGC